MLGKKWTWFGNDHSLNFHVQVSGVSRGCQESPASLSLSVDSMSLHCLSFEENGFRPPPPPYESSKRRIFNEPVCLFY